MQIVPTGSKEQYEPQSFGMHGHSKPNDLFLKPDSLSGLDSLKNFAALTKTLTTGKTTDLQAAKARAKENFQSLNLKMGPVGLTRAGSISRHQFNFRAFSEDLKSKPYGISQIKQSTDTNEKNWYTTKLRRIIFEIK